MSPTGTARGRNWTSTFLIECLKVGECVGGRPQSSAGHLASAPTSFVSYSLAFLCVPSRRVLAERKVSREPGGAGRRGGRRPRVYETVRAAAANSEAYKSGFSHSPGGRKSEIKAWAGPCSLQRRQGRTHPCVFQRLGALGFRWRWLPHPSLCLQPRGASSASGSQITLPPPPCLLL